MALKVLRTKRRKTLYSAWDSLVILAKFWMWNANRRNVP